MKLGMHVCKRTIQKYMRSMRIPQPRCQKWSTFLHNHAKDVWACDALAGERSLLWLALLFFLIEFQSRKVMHVGVIRSPTGAWIAQQLREATSYGQAPKYLLCDDDSKFGSCFERVAATSGIEMLYTPYHAPRTNAIWERYLRRVRQAYLDHLLIRHDRIKGSSSSYPNSPDHLGPLRKKEQGWLLFRC